MAAKTPLIFQTNNGPVKIFAKKGERIRRRRSNAAMISDLMALKKSILLCSACAGRMPRGWTERYGYRMLHAMHTDGNCDGCQVYQSCDLFHYLEGDYVRQWDHGLTVLEAAKRQRIEIRDKRRIGAVS